MNRDIWTVVFNDEQELFLLKKQIESLIHYNNTLNYNIILNENNCDIITQKLDLLGITNLLNTAKFKVDVFTRQDFLSDEEADTGNIPCQGYLVQQMLKMQVHKKSLCDEHVILDAKNIIVKDNFLESCPGALTRKSPLHFFDCYNYYCKLWHKGKKRLVKGTNTPFIFKRAILEDFEREFKTRNDFINIFKTLYGNSSDGAVFHSHIFSEFIVYDLFEQYITKDYTSINNQDHIIARVEDFHFNKNSMYYYKLDSIGIIALHRSIVKEHNIKKANNFLDKFIYKDKVNP
jgi:hypothetical protein